MEKYGPVKQTKLIVDKNGKPRGYGFVEFEHESDMRGEDSGLRVHVVEIETGRHSVYAIEKW